MVSSCLGLGKDGFCKEGGWYSVWIGVVCVDLLEIVRGEFYGSINFGRGRGVGVENYFKNVF